MSDAPLDDPTLDQIVRRADPDRWLATRFIGEPAARADVVALYAFNNELARASEVASNALMGEIRLVWWREAMEEIAAGRPARRHPVVDALAVSAFDAQDLIGLAEARLADLDPGPFAEEGEALAYIDATAGLLAHMAARRLDAGAEPVHTRQAARAWALAGLWRASRVTGRSRLPVEWNDKGVAARVSAAINAANREGRGLPAAAFPAIAYATLARPYSAGAEISDLGRKARLTWAVARGRL